MSIFNLNFNNPAPRWKYVPGDTVWIFRCMKPVKAVVKAQPSGFVIDRNTGEYEVTFKDAIGREWEEEIRMFPTRKACLEHLIEWTKETLEHDKAAIQMHQQNIRDYTKHLVRLQKELRRYK